MQAIRKRYLYLLTLLCALPTAARAVELGALSPICATQDYGQLQINKSVQGGQLKIGNRTFHRGLGTHSSSEIAYDLNGQYNRFTAWVGVDAEMKDYKQPSVVFKVFADGRALWSSGIMRIDTQAKRVSVPITGTSELRLVVEDAGDGIECDHADWGDPMLFGTPQSAPVPEAKYSVRAPGITLMLSDHGEVSKAILGKTEHVFAGRLRLLGCTEGSTTTRILPNGGMEFVRTVTHPSGECRVTERFIPTGNSIRWQVEIAGKGAPWSTPIISQFRWPDTKDSLFWTAWDDPEPDGSGWHDPLVAKPFANKTLLLGMISIPIATILTSSDDSALSLIWSPEDTYLYASLATGKDGTVSLARSNHRIGGAQPIRFSADFVPHKADWRAALGWMVSRYPSYFNPPNPAADDMAGCGAYSYHEGDLDAARFRKMAFRVNWKASFDFPYIGMFLPPVNSDDEKWFRFDSDSGGSPNGKHTETSINQMAAYSKRMRGLGFHVLNYFNVTEMGTRATSDPQPERPWSDPGKYVYSTFGDAIAANEAGQRVGSWGGSLLMDCAVPSYRNFLLEQAKRHIDKFPASSGICIDRMDWLSHYNSKADDGVSWRVGKPMRALSESWKSTMSRLGQLMHSNGKVIFANPLTSMRLDLMKEVDGVYHEFGHQGPYLNGAAFLCLRKPAIAWTPAEWALGDDRDAFFQRHLHMGVFPTAPFPGNDHTIRPSESADKWYLDYGPLLDLMRGKKWVLDPHVIQAEGSTKVNLFEVPGGYVVPVTFGGQAESVKVTIRKPSKLGKWPASPSVEAIHPGSDQPVKVSATVNGNVLQLTVPLSRGCAMVRISL